MSSYDFPIIFRHAKDNEYETIGHLHDAAFAPDPMIQLIWSGVDPDVELQWQWIDGVKEQVAKGGESVIVMERTDTGELVGSCWYRRYSRAKPPRYPDALPEGVNLVQFNKMEKPTVAWLGSLTDKYGEFLYIHEFAIAPHYQSRGLGKQLARHLIALAKEQGLNIALTATSGKSAFWTKFGFVEVAPHIMLANGTVEGINMMILELEKPSSDRKQTSVSSVSPI